MNPMRNNKGFAMPMVLLVLTIAVIFGFASLNMIDAQTRFNIIDDSGKKAIEYAEAGYNDYLWHLNDDVNFYDTAASDAMLSKIGDDGVYHEVWIPFMDGEYKLEVTKPSDVDRFVTIKSTGRANSNESLTRTIEAKIRKKQFVHHVYVSDDDGDEIWWTTGDESHGPYHTNNDLYTMDTNSGVNSAALGQRVYYPVFFDTVTFSGSHTESIANGYKSSAYQAGIPTQVDRLEFPATNAQLKAWAQKDGMVFYGRTCIYLDGTNVKIRNGNADTATTYSLSSIANKVIYVDKATGGGTSKFDSKTGNIFISGQLTGRLTIAAANDIYITYKDPTNWDKPTDTPSSTGGITYKTTTFNSTHPGVLSYFDNTKNIWTRDASGSDMLGLVANNNVMILHYNWPRDPDSGDDYWDDSWWIFHSDLDVAPTNISIHAAVFAVNGGFGFEGSSSGSKGDITLWGNITQKERLAVGTTGGAGYKKKYAHDPRMFYDYPPHILEPVNVGWEVHDWKEIN